MIIAGVIGSVITLFLTALFDYLKERYREKIEMRKLVFQRKTDAAENAVSWLQESINCYRMLQLACNDIKDNYNILVWERIMMSSNQANKLYLDTRKFLNPIYLYYDFKEIEKKYSVLSSSEYINYAINQIGKLNQIEFELQNTGVSNKSDELKKVQQNRIWLFKELYKAIDDQICSMAEMISILRKEYSIYCDKLSVKL